MRSSASDDSVAGADADGPEGGQNGIANLSREVPNRVTLDIVIERVPHARHRGRAVLGGFLESMAGALKSGQAGLSAT